MRSLALLAVASLIAVPVVPQSARPSADVNGEWLVTADVLGYPIAERLTLKVEKGKLTGTISSGRPLPITGTVSGDAVRFEWKDSDGTVVHCEGRLTDGVLSGTVTYSGETWGATPPGEWKATRFASDRPASPRTLDLEPTTFQRTFSATIQPVLHMWPGDTVRTRTVDAGGVDENGKTRVLGGNPQTGPFYVEGAMPGDVLAIHIRKLRLNRATAISDDGLVDRAVTTDWSAEHKDQNKFNDVVWNLDPEHGVARLAKPTAKLKGLAVPLAPMLGCVAVAPGFARAAVGTGDSGRIGGKWRRTTD